MAISFLSLQLPLIDTCLSYLSPTEVRVMLRADRAQDSDVARVVRIRFEGMTYLWTLWAEVHGIVRDKKAPVDLNASGAEKDRRALETLYAKTNLDALSYIENTRAKWAKKDALAQIAVIEDPFLKRWHLQRDIFLFGEMTVGSPFLLAIQNNLHVVKLYLEALFPCESMREGTMPPDRDRSDIAYMQCFTSGMPFVEMYLREEGILNALTLYRTIESPQEEGGLQMIRRHLPYIDNQALEVAISSALRQLVVDAYRNEGGYTAEKDDQLWEAFKLLRAEAIKRGMALDDEGYLNSARSNKKPVIAQRLEELIGQVKVVEHQADVAGKI